MAETEEHHSPWAKVMPKESPDSAIDWEKVDRLIILMSLAIAQRLLRRKRTAMDPDIKIRLLDRLEKLIEEYKNPKPVRREPETW